MSGLSQGSGFPRQVQVALVSATKWTEGQKPTLLVLLPSFQKEGWGGNISKHNKHILSIIKKENSSDGWKLDFWEQSLCSVYRC